MPFRPMLAAKSPRLEDLKYPVLASPKLDGVRATMSDGIMFSRTMKPIPNRAIQAYFGELSSMLNYLDGELIVGRHDNGVYRRTVSAVMSHEGNPMPSLVWHVFDQCRTAERFSQRLDRIRKRVYGGPVTCTAVEVLVHSILHSPEEVMAMHEAKVAEGYEGLILRNPYGLYKQGRSTLNEQGMVKVKMFEDSEATVLDVVELMHNDNPQAVSEIGTMKRSSHKANKRASGMMGALSVRDLTTGVEFEIGTGFSDADRRAMWEQPPVGKIAKYKFFAGGVKDKPRFPVFLGWRSPTDI
jgi:DNA ligase-1